MNTRVANRPVEVLEPNVLILVRIERKSILLIDERETSERGLGVGFRVEQKYLTILVILLQSQYSLVPR